MKINEGSVYYVENEFINITQAFEVPCRHNGESAIYYCCYKDAINSLYWMVPVRSKTDKHQRLDDKETEKYGQCYSVVFGKYGDADAAFLIRGVFPVKKRHIHKLHTVRGSPICVERDLRKQIRFCFDRLMELYEKGHNFIKPDIDRIRRLIAPETYYEYLSAVKDERAELE